MNPLPAVAELASMSVRGARVLDLGAGTGRHAVFLARRGFSVDAVDASAPSVERLRAYAAEHSLAIRATVRDLSEELPDCHPYGAVVCTLVLHLMTPERARALLDNARSAATPGTVHVIAAITSEGDFVRDFAPGERYYPEPGEVARIYENEGWEVQLAIEEIRAMQETNPDGTPRTNLVSFVIATKPGNEGAS